MKSLLAIVLSLVALVLSGFACYRVLMSPVDHKPVSSYDFTTPVAALKSESQIVSDNNIPAMIELGMRADAPRAREKLRTLRVAKEDEWKGTKLLYISYEEDGVRKFQVYEAEKDADSGLWSTQQFFTFSLPSDATSIRESVDAWNSDGTIK